MGKLVVKSRQSIYFDGFLFMYYKLLFKQIILNIFKYNSITNLLKNSINIDNKRKELKKKYKQHLEEAYNLRQTDHAMSDVFEFSAIQLLNELNQLKYLNREPINNLDL